MIDCIALFCLLIKFTVMTESVIEICRASNETDIPTMLIIFNGLVDICKYLLTIALADNVNICT